MIAGIPDFRIYPCLHWQNEEDEVNTLLRNYDDLDFLNLFQLRQSFLIDSGRTEEELKKVRELHRSNMENLIEYHMDHSDIFSTFLRRFQYIIGKRIEHTGGTVLEIGCGKGTQINDMLSLYQRAVAIDNSLTTLIVAKKILDQKGIAARVQLVCACSESLPFESGSFDAANMKSVLEHVEDQDLSLRETKRVLKSGGVLLLETPNRFTVQKEPHVKVYGVGFVPRRWMKLYVDLVAKKQVTFGGIKSLSYFELHKLLTKNYGDHWEHRALLIDESRPGVTFIGRMYRKYGIVKKLYENIVKKMFCTTHYVAAWKK